MRDFRDAKAMAQTLREALKTKSVSVTHSESLELVAKILGFHDWNVLSAQIQSEPRPPAPGLSAAIPLPIPNGAGLPTIPLRDIVLFPRTTVPLYVGRDTTKRAIEHAMEGDKRVLALTQRRAADDNPTPNDLYGVGVTANIIHLTTFDDGNIRLIVEGLERVKVVHLAEGPFLTAEVAPTEESRRREAEALSLMPAVLETFAAYRNASLSSGPYAQLPHIREPSVLADAIAPFLHLGIDQKQDLLETGDVVTRLEKILAFMKTDRQSA
jgi:ATP-dependent Lon protease